MRLRLSREFAYAYLHSWAWGMDNEQRMWPVIVWRSIWGQSKSSIYLLLVKNWVYFIAQWTGQAVVFHLDFPSAEASSEMSFMLILFPSKHITTFMPDPCWSAVMVTTARFTEVHVYCFFFFFIEEEALMPLGFIICVLFVPMFQLLNHILKGTLSEIFSVLDEFCVRMN